MRQRLNNEKGQGTTEYIVILAIAVAIALAVFWPTIHTQLQTKVAAIATSISTAGN